MKSVQELMSLSGRVAAVTGGGGHIGRALCDALAELGAGVVVVDVQEQACGEVADRLHEHYGVPSSGLAVDLAVESQTRSICTRVLDHFGRLDILVNCAAFVGTSERQGWCTEFASQSSEAWRLAHELNLTVPFLLAQTCAEALGQHGVGSVINVASIYGLVGPDLRLYEGTRLGNPAAYAASKGGLLQLTRWLATVLAPRIRVNAITPGGIWRQQPEEFRQRYEVRCPLQRMGSEEELKGAVGYLASDLAAYVTGHNLVVDGGWTAW